MNAERFWSKVDIRGPDECWPWTAGRLNGYGYLWHAGRHVRAHRVSFELENGPIPDGLLICHECDNRPCCNPAHLWPGTHAQNVADRDRKGRTAKGERNGLSKLTKKKVRIIRGSADPSRKLAARFGVHQTTIQRVRARYIWGHV